jgi:long-chain acyl-CoA synthetase
VVFDQACEIAGNQALIDLWGITHEDRIAVALPLGFLYGLSTASAMGLQAGAEIVLLRRFHPQLVLNSFVEHRISVFHGVPTMFAMMLDYCEQNDLTIDLSFMRMLVCAGAPLSPALKQRFCERFGKAIDDYYALTEIRPVFGRYSGDDVVPPGAIGKAAPGTVIRIVDAEGCDVEEGESGELLARAGSTMLRYHKDPELTARSFRDGLFVTGDIGRRDANGQYYLTGRIKDIIICGGANISPAEVENALLRHDSIRAAAVVGRRDDKFGERPVAFVVRADALQHDDESVLAHCRALLADFKVPVALIDLPELPLGATGKVDKQALKTILEKQA